MACHVRSPFPSHPFVRCPDLVCVCVSVRGRSNRYDRREVKLEGSDGDADKLPVGQPVEIDHRSGALAARVDSKSRALHGRAIVRSVSSAGRVCLSERGSVAVSVHRARFGSVESPMLTRLLSDFPARLLSNADGGAQSSSLTRSSCRQPGALDPASTK